MSSGRKKRTGWNVRVVGSRRPHAPRNNDLALYDRKATWTNEQIRFSTKPCDWQSFRGNQSVWERGAGPHTKLQKRHHRVEQASAFTSMIIHAWTDFTG